MDSVPRIQLQISWTRVVPITWTIIGLDLESKEVRKDQTFVIHSIPSYDTVVTIHFKIRRQHLYLIKIYSFRVP
jgi:hypothetical protein